MSTKLQAIWDARSPREQKAIILLVTVLGILLYLWLVVAADSARTRMVKKVEMLRTTTARLDKEIIELERLRALPAVASSKTELRLLVQAQAEVAGLLPRQFRLEPMDPDRIQIAFNAVPFANMLTFLDNLKSQQIRLASARIEALPTAGLTSGTGTLVRNRQE